MDRVSHRLLSRLHSVYNADPAPVLALRIRHADGVVWRVHGYVLTLETPAGTSDWALSDYTLLGLATDLSEAGFDVPRLNPALQHLSATVLMEGMGAQDVSNGDHLYAYTSILWTLLGAMGPSFTEAKDAIELALRQLILPHSTQEWADLFGEIFGIPRLNNELDAVYTARMIEEVKRARSNPIAIIKNVKRLTGYDVEVREPWKELHVLSESPLDGSFHMQGGSIWQYHTAQIISRAGVDWDAVMFQANADRPAGTIYLDPATHYPPAEVDCTERSLIASRTDYSAEQLWGSKDGVLDYNLDLSNYSITLNHPMVVYVLSAFNGEPIQEQVQFTPALTFVKGEVVLSEAPPLGDLQGHFPGATWQESGDYMHLSGEQGLSDYFYRLDLVPIDEWLDANHQASFFWSGADIITSGAQNRTSYFYRSRTPLFPNWEGYWDDRAWREWQNLKITAFDYTGEGVLSRDLDLSNYQLGEWSVSASQIDAATSYDVLTGRNDWISVYVPHATDMLGETLTLSAYQPIINHAINIISHNFSNVSLILHPALAIEMVRSDGAVADISYAPAPSFLSIYPPYTVSLNSIALSDSTALGDDNARFSGTMANARPQEVGASLTGYDPTINGWIDQSLVRELSPQSEEQLSVSLAPSNYRILLNHQSVTYQNVFIGVAGLDSNLAFTPSLTFGRGEVTLSEYPESGTVNYRLAGTQVDEAGESMTLSDLSGLSDYSHTAGVKPIDEWLDSNNADSLLGPSVSISSTIGEW